MTAMAEIQNAVEALRAGNAAGALEASERAILAEPANIDAQHIKAMALGHLGRIGEAAPIFEMVAAHHGQSHIVLANYANALKFAGQTAAALDHYRKAVAVAPNFANGWFNLGATLAQEGDARDAEAAYRKALDIDAGHLGAFNNLAVLFNEEERAVEALEITNRGLQIQPRHAGLLLSRGRAFRGLGRFEEAVADHRKAVAIAPGLVETNYQLANSLRQAGNMAAAESAYLKALEFAPTQLDLHQDLARMLWEAGRAEGYLDALDRAIAQNPNVLPIKVARAELALLGGDIDGAAAAARQVIALAPKLAGSDQAQLGRAYCVQARLERERNQMDQAIADFEHARAAAPDDFEILHEYAEGLLVAGESKKAAKVLEGEAPLDHLQKHIGLKALAMRASGDPGYRQYYDYERLTAKLFIDTPPGYSSLDEFNAALIEAIRALHKASARPLEQTLYGGTQSFGRLWNEPAPAIQAMKAALLKLAAKYIEALPDDPGHPFLRRKSTNLSCAGAWSVMLASGGGHVDHIHPEGWISACYYVRVPEEVTAGDRAGFLRLGASGVRGLDLPAERWIKPEAGSVIFFPSYMWHGVERFEATSARITAPFDLAVTPG